MNDEHDSDFISIQTALWIEMLPYLVYLDDSKESIDLKRNRISIQAGTVEVIPVRLDFTKLYNGAHL
jgi:hypothetical protein